MLSTNLKKFLLVICVTSIATYYGLVLHEEKQNDPAYKSCVAHNENMKTKCFFDVKYSTKMSDFPCHGKLVDDICLVKQPYVVVSPENDRSKTYMVGYNRPYENVSDCYWDGVNAPRLYFSCPHKNDGSTIFMVFVVFLITIVTMLI